MTFLLQGFGIGLVGLALADIFLTVLYARSGTGMFAPRVTHYAWRGMVLIAPVKLLNRNRFLSYGGPLMMVLSVALWVGMLLVGSAFVVWSALGSGIEATDGSTPAGFTTALYYAGFSLTTLGIGDLVPTSPALRGFTIAMAAIGFSVVTLTITYFMSVYGALVRRNALAQALHHFSGGTGDAAQLLAHLGRGDDFDAARSHLAMLGMAIIDLAESHQTYPVLQYFRMREARYSMARIALILLETSALARSALGPRHEAFSYSASIELLSGSAVRLCLDASQTFIWRQGRLPEGGQRYHEALAVLRKAGIQVVDEEAAGEAAYLQHRDRWIEHVHGLAVSAGYRWDEIVHEPIAREA